MKSLSILALLLFLLGGITACANKTMNDQHARAQDNSGSMGGGMSGGSGGGGGY
jgi:hypothetical protein